MASQSSSNKVRITHSFSLAYNFNFNFKAQPLIDEREEAEKDLWRTETGFDDEDSLADSWIRSKNVFQMTLKHELEKHKAACYDDDCETCQVSHKTKQN